MVKKINFKKHIQSAINDQDDDELSDLEVDIGGDAANEYISINQVDQIESACNKINQEFNKLMKKDKVNWIETLDITAKDSIDSDLNVDDDIKRELIFYNLTVANAAQGISKLKQIGEKLNRPGDFFAEMMKGDNQMEKIRKQIVNEKTRIKKLEEKKNKIHNVKFAKAMKDKQNKDKASFKKQSKNAVDSWKEHIKNKPNDYYKLDDFLDGDNNQNRGGKGKFKQFKNNSKNSFSSFRGRDKNSNVGSKFGKFNNKTQRPGKIKRMIQRNKKNSRK